MNLDTLLELTPVEPCTGLVYKGYTSTYLTGNRVEEKRGLRLLSRKSCRCNGCLSMQDEVETAVNDGFLLLPDRIEPGQLYTAVITNKSYDWESGICDGYDIEFREIQP